MKSVIAVMGLFLFLAACGPSEYDKQRLAFEEQKYKDEQAAKAQAAAKEAEDKQEQSARWFACRARADNEYNNEESLWGEPVPGKPGVRSGPANQLQDLKNRLQRKNEECDRNFPKGISY